MGLKHSNTPMVLGQARRRFVCSCPAALHLGLMCGFNATNQGEWLRSHWADLNLIYMDMYIYIELLWYMGYTNPYLLNKMQLVTVQSSSFQDLLLLRSFLSCSFFVPPKIAGIDAMWHHETNKIPPMASPLQVTEKILVKPSLLESLRPNLESASGGKRVFVGIYEAIRNKRNGWIWIHVVSPQVMQWSTDSNY